MSDSKRLTGKWAGNYWQHGQVRPISAELVETENSFTGRMRDGVTESERSVFDSAALAGLPPGSDEVIEAQIRTELDLSSTEQIRAVTHLPEESMIEGKREGIAVYFQKQYQGETFCGFRAGDRVMGVRSEGHVVNYQGKLNLEGTELEGRWWIDAEPELGTPRTDGDFILRRQL